MAYYMSNPVKEVRRGDIFYIANSKCYATNPPVEVEREPVETPVIVERNLYKTLYEDLLNKVVAR